MATNQSALDFAHAARVLGREARRRGLVAPSYRCPPRIVGVQRSLRRFPQGGATVAVQLKGRPWLAVLGDMIEGVVVANGLLPPQADRLRNELWQAVGAQPSQVPRAKRVVRAVPAPQVDKAPAMKRVA
ncbi:MAG: hypothetical protein WCC60_10330 [Ilumatobacteraceae bacterium]